LETEAKRLQQTALSLVHGDYSPKNILLSSDRFVILDCEVAWYGDPAFDVAFIMNHFLPKSLHFAPNIDPFLALISLFWDNYQQILNAEHLNGLEERVARLLLMLILARIDGKSPAEYVTQETKRNQVRYFVKKLLPQGDYQLSAIMSQWRAQFV
jgi:thiamine kinase-like enzyme